METLTKTNYTLDSEYYQKVLMSILDSEDFLGQQPKTLGIISQVTSLETYIRSLSLTLDLCLGHLIKDNIYPLNYYVYKSLQTLGSDNKNNIIYFEQDKLYIVFNGTKQKLDFWNKTSFKMAPILIRLHKYLEEYYDHRVKLTHNIINDIKPHIGYSQKHI